jgi:dTDP-4-dehydrorhamnose 3,5-epimerase
MALTTRSLRPSPMKLVIMKIEPTKIADLFWLDSNAFIDERGTFFRAFCANDLAKAGLTFDVKQTNVSINPKKRTMRGFHYQKLPAMESKILTCLYGSVYNVVIDLRQNSETFLDKAYFEISSRKPGSLLIPPGCANAFMTMEHNTQIYYLMDTFFSPEAYTGFRYDDPHFQVEWPCVPEIISAKDNAYPDFELSQLL